MTAPSSFAVGKKTWHPLMLEKLKLLLSSNNWLPVDQSDALWLSGPLFGGTSILNLDNTGEYWPELVAVHSECIEIRTKTTEGQYSSVRLELARLVSSLLHGTRFLIVLVANFEFVGFAPKQKYTNGTVSTETVRTAKSRPTKNQSERSDLPKTGIAI